ncbi:MAG: dihydrolipoamide acetyltransferase family protein [Jaaginema sp. PMC 1079.18]|nr:dihydrolipoamide acetyltransferase family protein [Jaaginema sp. PMC 1080.18]MEC4849773.1 dihydrolipoamide acetyltransferase family protein [Jaaginema sp. PMC 1079.18]MEC4865698.1 dihydrolipoamide acetyltransferase family protein [Jaaginema sp. PMC 1078.18]
MIHDIFMPALSSTMTEGKIVSWVKSPGDKIEKGETVVVVESDKADMDVESFHEGYLASILVEAGQDAPVGAAIALLAETEAEIATAKQKAASDAPAAAPSVAEPEPTPAPVAAPASTSSSSNGRIVASPRARKLAKELKVDINTLKGSGPYGRIVAADVEAATGTATAKAPSPAAAPTPVTKTATAPPAPPRQDPAAVGGKTIAMNTLQKAVVRNMIASLEVPDFRVGYTIITDELDKLYKKIKPKGVTMTALLAKAIAITLQKHPIVNAAYVTDSIQYNENINVSVAVAMPDGGLITPVLQNADQIDIYSLSRTWKDLVDRARSKQLQPAEYNTGTFTISNLGMFGVDRFDAILPPGQGAILAVGASRPQVVASPDGMMRVQRQMQVNLTCDHRTIYGADAAAFLKDLAQLLEADTHSLTL